MFEEADIRAYDGERDAKLGGLITLGFGCRITRVAVDREARVRL
jgi:hypothetical protein